MGVQEFGFRMFSGEDGGLKTKTSHGNGVGVSEEAWCSICVMSHKKKCEQSVRFSSSNREDLSTLNC